jgi:hypothetical protein
MSFLQQVMYWLEDMVIKLTTKKEMLDEVMRNTNELREQKRIQREEQIKLLETQRLEQEARERAEVESILEKVVDIQALNYTQYEYNEVKRNAAFFRNLISRVFEKDEQGLTFVFCEFDKSSKREIQGYLLVTNKRVLFLTKSLSFMDKFCYQTIINVTWFKDSAVEKGLYIQYGKKRLEFDEIYDFQQLKRVGDLILKLSSNY